MEETIVHPLVLLSITDHHSRYNSTRVIGVLLGTDTPQTQITNSFALPFDETGSTYFVDTSYLQHMLSLHRKINAKEKVLGWYHTGSILRPSDSYISTLFISYVENPLLLVVNLYTKNIPLKMYKLQEDLIPIQCRIEAEEAEEVGVEHLIRDIKNDDDDEELYVSLQLYKRAIETIINYINDVMENKIVGNYEIMNEIQECLNERVIDFDVSEDLSLCYLACLIKGVIMLKELECNRKKRYTEEVY